MIKRLLNLEKENIIKSFFNFTGPAEPLNNAEIGGSYTILKINHVFAVVFPISVYICIKKHRYED